MSGVCAIPSIELRVNTPRLTGQWGGPKRDFAGNFYTKSSLQLRLPSRRAARHHPHNPKQLDSTDSWRVSRNHWRSQDLQRCYRTNKLRESELHIQMSCKHNHNHNCSKSMSEFVRTNCNYMNTKYLIQLEPCKAASSLLWPTWVMNQIGYMCKLLEPLL